MIMFMVILLGVFSDSHGHIPVSLSEVTAGPGDNITLYCDCQLSAKGLHIVWYRNDSHENQRRLVPAIDHLNYSTLISPGFRLIKNDSSRSYDLLIMNITISDEGLYSCGTEWRKVMKNYPHNDGKCGSITRVIFNSSKSHDPETPEVCDVCWRLLFSLCPASALLSSLLSYLVYHFHHKTVNDEDQQTPETRCPTTPNQDEDVCYAPLEIRQASQKPRIKRTKSSDFCTYSAISTSR